MNMSSKEQRRYQLSAWHPHYISYYIGIYKPGEMKYCCVSMHKPILSKFIRSWSCLTGLHKIKKNVLVISRCYNYRCSLPCVLFWRHVEMPRDDIYYITGFMNIIRIYLYHAVLCHLQVHTLHLWIMKRHSIVLKDICFSTSPDIWIYTYSKLITEEYIEKCLHITIEIKVNNYTTNEKPTNQGVGRDCYLLPTPPSFS
jgi:hypothetical protein